MGLWICADEYPAVSAFYYFQKTFCAQEGETLRLKACGDARYRLYLNGEEVCEGPCQGSEYVRHYETVDTPLTLRQGENYIQAKVFFPTEKQFITMFRAQHPAFWMDGVLTDTNGQTRHIGTDESWTCQREDGVRFHGGGRVHFSVFPFEEMLAESKRTPVAVRALYEPSLEEGGYSDCGIRDLYPMRPRPIPFMQLEDEKDMLRIKEGDGFIELDAGAYTTAMTSISFCAKRGARIRVIYSESCTVEEKGVRCKKVRDDFESASSRVEGDAIDIMEASGEEQIFSPFWYRAFRFVRIEFLPDADFSLLSMRYRSCHYPLDADGTFVCSNERYNRMWQISRNTVLCCMHEIYMDCPYYEQQQYDMDSALEMLFTFRMASDTRMPLKSLTDLAHSQLQDGMLQANYPSTYTQVIPDFTMFWILMLRDYLRYTGDVQSVRGFLGTMDKALEAFENLRDDSGLVGTSAYWYFVDWVPSWSCGIPTGGKEEPLTVVSLMFAAALRAGAEICRALGRELRAAEYEARANEMTALVNRLCYDEEVGLYQNTPTKKEYCQHTTLWAILSGAMCGMDAKGLMHRTFHADVKVEACTFSMNHYLFRALEHSECYEYAPILFAGWENMLDMHCTTWCENPDSPRSECHGWSSAPIYEFSAMVLGVYPTDNGYQSLRIKPYVSLPDLRWARGTVPTPQGIVSVDWEIQNETFLLHVVLPKGCDMQTTVVLPSGEEILMQEEEASFSCAL